MTTTTETEATTIPRVKRITGEARAKLAGELAEKYASGASIRAIADDTGRSYGFVYRMLTENGVVLRNQGGVAKP